MAIEFLPYMPIQCECGRKPKSSFLYGLLMGKLLIVGLAPTWRSIFPVRAYTAYLSVGESLKSLLSHGLPMGKLLVVWLRPKWRSSFSLICLYGVCECGRKPKTTISVRISYGKVVGSRVMTKMAIDFFPYMPIQRM